MHMGGKPFTSCTFWSLFGVNQPSSFRDMTGQRFWPFDLWWPWPLTLTFKNKSQVTYSIDTSNHQIRWLDQPVQKLLSGQARYKSWPTSGARPEVQKNTKSRISRKRCILRRKVWAVFLCGSSRGIQWSLFQVDTTNTFRVMTENVIWPLTTGELLDRK